MPETPVDGGNLAECPARALDREEVEHRSRHEDGPGIHQQQQARVIDAVGDHAVGILLGVAVGILEDAIGHAHRERGDETGRGRDADPRIERGDDGGLEAPAAGARDADARGIDLGSREQIVERTHAIPHFPARDVGAGKVGQIAQDGVLATNQVVAALPGRGVPELASLALAHGIPADHDVPARGQPLAQGLIVGLAVGRVAGRHQHRRMVPPAVVRDVHQGRHEDPRQTLEDDFLDVKTGHLESDR